MFDVFVSFIVPCYNVQDYLPRCISSLEKQAIPGREVEFILVNDGSKDGTLEIIRHFAERDKRARLLDQANQGVSVARNNGLAIARGEYVFFLDGDDWLTDDASLLMYNFCKETHPDVVLFSNYKFQEGSTEGVPWYTSTNHIAQGVYSTTDYLHIASYFPISFKLYRRAFLNNHGITFDEHLVAGEVYTFFIHALSLSSTVGVSPSYIMYYLKRRGQSATTTINVDRDLTILDTLHTVNQYVGANCAQMKEKRAFLTSSFWMVTAFALIKYVGHSKYRRDIGELLSQVREDKDYNALLRYFTGKGFSLSKHSLLAFCIRFLSPRIAYGIIRSYYRWATRDREA